MKGLDSAQCAFLFLACLAAVGILYEVARFVVRHIWWRGFAARVHRAPWDGAIAGKTGNYYVARWDRHDKWDAAVRGRIVGTPRIRR